MPEVPCVNRLDVGPVFAVEVECRWFVGQYMRKALRAVGIP